MDWIRKWITEIDSMHGEWGQDGRELWGDNAKHRKSRGLRGMSQHSLRVLRDVTPTWQDRSSWIFRTLWNCLNLDQGLFPHCTTSYGAHTKWSLFRMGCMTSRIFQYAQETHHQCFCTSSNWLHNQQASHTFSRFMPHCYWDHTLTIWQERTKITCTIQISSNEWTRSTV